MMEVCRCFRRPSGMRGYDDLPFPGVETPGYCQRSLRDHGRGITTQNFPRGTPSPQEPQKFPRLIVVTRKHFRQILVSHVAGHRFSDHLAEIRGQGEITAFVEL